MYNEHAINLCTVEHGYMTRYYTRSAVVGAKREWELKHGNPSY